MKARNLTSQQVIETVFLAAQPTRKFVLMEDVAALASYLASESASSITGSSISIDGGWTAH